MSSYSNWLTEDLRKAKERIAELKAENEQLREILHTERQAISKRMNRVKKAASRLDSAIYVTVLDLEGE